MATARVTFHSCIQNSQEAGDISNDKKHMFSRINFTLEVNGQKYENMYVDISQPFGTDYTKEPIEVGPPQGGSYNGPFNHQAFSEGVESYYRSLIGAQGSVVCFEPNATVVMRNNLMRKDWSFQFEVPASDAN